MLCKRGKDSLERVPGFLTFYCLGSIKTGVAHARVPDLCMPKGTRAGNSQSRRQSLCRRWQCACQSRLRHSWAVSAPQSQAREDLPCAGLSCRISDIFPDPRRSICPAPWLFQSVDFVQSPGRAFCDPAPASPCFRTSDKGLAKGLRSSRLQDPQEIGLSLSFGFACRPPNAFAGIRTDIPTSYQTVTQTQYS